MEEYQQQDILDYIDGSRDSNENDSNQTDEEVDPNEVEGNSDEDDFNAFTESEQGSYDEFLDSLMSGELDGNAMGDKAAKIYDTYGTTNINKANKYYNSAGSSMNSLIANRESDGGDYGALPRRKDGSLASSAVGKYQFLWNEHHDWIEKLTGVKSKEEFRNSPEAQEQAFEHWETNTLAPQARRLKSRLPQYNEEQIKLMLHFAGAGNVEKAIQSGNFDKPLDGFGSSLNSYLNKRQYGGGDEPQPKPKLTYEQWRNNLPNNLKNTDTTTYNLRGAYEGGLQPELNEDGSYHLGSRNPLTGEILKLPNHPTWNKMLQGEKEAGYELYKMNGKNYSRPIKREFGGDDPKLTTAKETSWKRSQFNRFLNNTPIGQEIQKQWSTDADKASALTEGLSYIPAIGLPMMIGNTAIDLADLSTQNKLDLSSNATSILAPKKYRNLGKIVGFATDVLNLNPPERASKKAYGGKVKSKYKF